MINVSPIGRNCSQEERDEFEKYDKVNNLWFFLFTPKISNSKLFCYHRIIFMRLGMQCGKTHEINVSGSQHSPENGFCAS
jgi:hypothetical protein